MTTAAGGEASGYIGGVAVDDVLQGPEVGALRVLGIRLEGASDRRQHRQSMPLRRQENRTPPHRLWRLSAIADRTRLATSEPAAAQLRHPPRALNGPQELNVSDHRETRFETPGHGGVLTTQCTSDPVHPPVITHGGDAGSGGQPRAQDVGVGVAQVVEDGQRSPPAAVRGRDVARVPVGVAEADERVGLGMATAQLLVQVQRVVVAGDGPLVLAEVLVLVEDLLAGVRPCP